MTGQSVATALVLLALGAWAPAAGPAPAKTQAAEILAGCGVSGGLCVHLGCGQGELTTALARDGRFLVHALDNDPAAVARTIARLRAADLYGQGWAERHALDRLPYAENLVNLVVAPDAGQAGPNLRKIFRVMCPNGVICVGQVPDPANFRKTLEGAGFTDVQMIPALGSWMRATKPWPADMDEWGHPRHGPSGNAVSRDLEVGPVRRIRWIAGPMHEISNIVTAGGRFFYAGTIARDAFNGLRLWQRALDPTPARLGFPGIAIKGSVLPVAANGRLYVVSQGRLQALDPVTGQTVWTSVIARTPLEILCEGKTLVACDADGAWACDADSGKTLWTTSVVNPQSLIAGDGGVYCLEGQSLNTRDRGMVKLELATGQVVWRELDYPWGAAVRRLSYDRGLVVCEVSSLNDFRANNAIHVLDAASGREVWEHLYEPGQNHYMQARAMQIGELVWVLAAKQWEGLDRRTGQVRRRLPGWANHCFPPAATARFLLGGEMNFLDIDSGRLDANQISKGACGRDTGFVAANGLLYTAPEHCACYPMLKSYSALAPARPGSPAAPSAPKPADYKPQRGPAWPANLEAAGVPAADWPGYRCDIWRSASTPATVPHVLDVKWTAPIGGWPNVPAVVDWKDNLYGRGPLTPPVAAGGLVVVAQIDGQRVVALDATTGKPRWDFTANGRIDSPPTLWSGLCLFGTRSGWAYCLRARDGQVVWRMRIGDNDERIISYGQLESPWPVAGSVLVIDGTLYLAAGRHPLADGGIRVLAMNPATGAVKWIKTINHLPMKGFYGGSALEFDPVDLLVAECDRPKPGQAGAGTAGRPAQAGRPDRIAMSRWQIDLTSGEQTVAWESGFGFYRTGRGGVLAPRGVWTYGQRMQYLGSGLKPGNPDFIAVTPRPLAAFRDSMLITTSETKKTLFRRDFNDEDLATFKDSWFNQRHLPRGLKVGDHDRSERLAHGSAWSQTVFPASQRQQQVGAMVLTKDAVFVAGTQGKLLAFSPADGKLLAQRDLPALIWDGLAAANGCLYASTADGKIICLGAK